VASQEEHAAFGGVVPEVASRAHQRLIVPTVQQALRQAGVEQGALDAVAVTHGPGLAGALLVGLSFAKAYALALGIRLIGVNHLEGHLYSPFLSDAPPALPYLCLVVSGGHTQLVLVEEGLRHTTLGKTRDDAAGEAFDKVAKLVGLGYPGGPAVDRLAAQGDPATLDLPRTFLDDGAFSFSGVKTAVRYAVRDDPTLVGERLAGLCASFQQCVVDMLMGPFERAAEQTGVRDVAIVGGVSANRGLRAAAQQMAERRSLRLHVPHPRFCTDNAAMIGIAGLHRLRAGFDSPLTLAAAPSLSLDAPLAA
jgi:N6-L-threonylcarbamoyladenine synthase